MQNLQARIKPKRIHFCKKMLPNLHYASQQRDVVRHFRVRRSRFLQLYFFLLQTYAMLQLTSSQHMHERNGCNEIIFTNILSILIPQGRWCHIIKNKGLPPGLFLQPIACDRLLCVRVCHLGSKTTGRRDLQNHHQMTECQQALPMLYTKGKFVLAQTQNRNR